MKLSMEERQRRISEGLKLAHARKRLTAAEVGDWLRVGKSDMGGKVTEKRSDGLVVNIGVRTFVWVPFTSKLWKRVVS